MSVRNKRIVAAVRQLRDAFGSPGDYGYETTKGKAIKELFDIHDELVRQLDPAIDAASLEDRLGDCLAAAIDTALLTVRDPDGCGRSIELRLGSFKEELAERAAGLLEEAGK